MFCDKFRFPMAVAVAIASGQYFSVRKYPKKEV